MPLKIWQKTPLSKRLPWLLLRGNLPTPQQLKDYKIKLKQLHTYTPLLKLILEKIPANAYMMDVLRTGCSFLGHLEPETKQQDPFAIADRLIASFGSILLYWYNLHKHNVKVDLNTNQDTIAGHILKLYTSRKRAS